MAETERTIAGDEPSPPALAALMALFQRGAFAEAIAEADTLLGDWPRSFMLWSILGASCGQSGEPERAIAAFEQAGAIRPQSAEAAYNLAMVLAGAGRLEQAVASYTRALALRPDYAEAHNNLGNVQNRLGQLDAAAASYRRSLALNPANAEAHRNLGALLNRQGKLDEADEAYRRALALKPDLSAAWCNLGIVLDAQGKLVEALDAYQRALALRPDFGEAEAHVLHQLQQVCDWRAFDMVPATCATLLTQASAPAPFNLLSLVDDAALHLAFSRKWARQHFTEAPLPGLPAKPAARPERLRIGYFSADFHDHATLHLMSGLLREHDKTRFEIYAYSYGRRPAGVMGDRARGDVDRFFDVADLSSRAIADLARSHALAIAIDLKGYTAEGRSELFQFRPAPIQISYLGYPGTLGADCMDYIIADPVVIPPDQRQFYSERVIYLPHCYQPNDNTRAIGTQQTSRADHGLPAQGFVFCCFNNSYKLSPREFAIWMRLLGRIEGSVLWLLKANPWCRDNLRREAAARGIDPARLVFADRVPQPDHLARHRHADLFLDTFNYNAHTTASDALWAGLPVVTRAGGQFAARVSASLLTAVGLPELITETDADYEALAFALANDPARLGEIRMRLAANRLARPLFDTLRYTRTYEARLDQAHDIYLSNQAPRDFGVEL